nr:MAG TPA: hypothetical protein [Caudoviricetes sp.]
MSNCLLQLAPVSARLETVEGHRRLKHVAESNCNNSTSHACFRIIKLRN